MAGTLLLACGGPDGGSEPPRLGATQPQLDRLDRAVQAVNATRAAALAAPDVVTGAASALDAADEACATGQGELAAATRRAAVAAVEPVESAVDALPQVLAAYRTALSELSAAAEPLDDAQEQVVVAAATAGEVEAAALAAFGSAAAALWPSYAALDQVQSTWLQRSTAGWFRSQREAADAYTVLRKPVRPELERASASLARSDADRRPATERMRSALRAADASLEVLRSPAA